MDDERVLPLSRRVRPRTRDEYVGNTKMVASVMQILAVKPFQVVLLEGASGCGKTTLARIIGKEFRCLNRDPEKGACGVCENCLAMDEYILTGSTDGVEGVMEIDVTEKSSKGELEAILDDAIYPDLNGGYKIYIFDECHMAQDRAQQRFLKFTEEPPERVVFIFCTTDPQKIIPTLLGRFQYRFKVTKPTLKELVDYLATVCTNEDVTFDRRGLNLIAVKSDFTVRKALNSLEMVINEKNSVKLQDVEDVLSVISDDVYYKLFTYLKEGDKFKYYSLIEDIATRYDLDNFVIELISFVQRALPMLNGVQLEGTTPAEIKSIKNLLTNFDEDFLIHFLDELILMRSDTETRKLRLLRLIYPFKRGTKLEHTDIIEQESVQDAQTLSTEALEEQRGGYQRYNEKRLYKYDNETDKKDVKQVYEYTTDELMTMFGGTVAETDPSDLVKRN